MAKFVAAAEKRIEAKRTAARLRFVAALFMLAFLVVGFRLVDIAGPNGEAIATASAALSTDPDPKRADVVDRRGVLMATNIATLSVVADPQLVPNHRRAAKLLAANLDDLDEATLYKQLSRNNRFAWIKRHVSPREQMIVQDLGIPGVSFLNSEKRVYPNGRLASHIVGFVDVDNQGLAGMEQAQQEHLVGGGEAGKQPLELSLDMRVQAVVHDALANAVDAFRALGGCAYVLDVRSREMVAMVSLPDFDPNAPTLAPPEARRNRCIGEVYELGSMFKLVNTAMALETGSVSMTERFNASKPLQIGRHKIRDDHAKLRWLSLPEIVAFSSNIGSVLMAVQAGGAEMQKAFLGALGLFERPKLAIAGTEAPLLPPRWIEIVSATVSYGHGIAVSPLQFGEAVAALVGDGRFERTHFLPRDPSLERMSEPVVSPQVTEWLRWLMWLTVAKGTSTKAAAEGYLVGGKTGTADKVAENGRGYQRGAVISSFLGAFPIHDPQYLVMVSLDEPQGNADTQGYRYAGWTAAPSVAEIIRAIGPLLGVQPVSPEVRERMEAQLRIMPTINGRTQREEDGFEFVGPTR